MRTAMPQGICINIAHSCSKAIHYEIQVADYGHDFVCAECGSPMCPYSKSEPAVGNVRKAGISPTGKAAIVAAIILASATAYYAFHSLWESTVGHDNSMAAVNRTHESVGKESTPAPTRSQPYASARHSETKTPDPSAESDLNSDTTVAITHDIATAQNNPRNIQAENSEHDTPNMDSTKPVFGNCASLSASGIITFKQAYTLDLRTREGEVLHLSPGDQIIDPIIRNNRLRAGYIITKNGKEKLYVSGLDNPI